jgi:hypothetical protein
MNNVAVLARGLVRVLIPTTLQVMAAVFIAMLGLLAAQTHELFARLGISEEAIGVARQHALDRFSVILQSSFVSNFALVAFWAGIGLVAYLLCWSAYNAVIEARNEVTIETQYTNKGHWQGIIETLALKAVAALLLMLYVVFFQYGLALWLALGAGLFTQVDAGHIVAALGAVLGLAAQLYGLLVLIQLTIMPWYRTEVFTDQQK